MSTTTEPHIVTSQRKVAQHFGVSLTTIHNWMCRPNPMPSPVGRGKYDLSAIEKWHAETFSKDKDQKPTETEGDGKSVRQIQMMLQLEKLRKETALATQNEYKAQSMSDGFVSVTDVNVWIAEFLALQRKLLTDIPMEMFAAVPDDHRKVYQPDLEARINIHLNQMADYVERVEDLGRKS